MFRRCAPDAPGNIVAVGYDQAPPRSTSSTTSARIATALQDGGARRRRVAARGHRRSRHRAGRLRHALGMPTIPTGVQPFAERFVPSLTRLGLLRASSPEDPPVSGHGLVAHRQTWGGDRASHASIRLLARLHRPSRVRFRPPVPTRAERETRAAGEPRHRRASLRCHIQVAEVLPRHATSLTTRHRNRSAVDVNVMVAPSPPNTRQPSPARSAASPHFAQVRKQAWYSRSRRIERAGGADLVLLITHRPGDDAQVRAVRGGSPLRLPSSRYDPGPYRADVQSMMYRPYSSANSETSRCINLVTMLTAHHDIVRHLRQD